MSRNIMTFCQILVRTVCRHVINITLCIPVALLSYCYLDEFC